MSNNKVKSYAERIERLLDERAAIDADIKDIYTEVKAADLKPKVLRKSIANKRRKVDAQFEKEVEEYSALLLALPGATYRAVAEQTGIPKSTLQRRVPKRARGTTKGEGASASVGDEVNGSAEPTAEQCATVVAPPATPHDPETGEINEPTADRGGGDAGVAEDASMGALPTADEGSTGDAGGDQGRLADSGADMAAGQPGEPARQVVAPGPQDPIPAFSQAALDGLKAAANKPDLFQRITGSFRPLRPEDDDLTPPAFLRRAAR